jgi:hypothetical protein
MYPHRIRLRGPWTCEPLFRLVPAPDGSWQRSTENLPPGFRLRMPGHWSDAGLGEFRGGVRCVRPFGYPGKIDDDERVWLTFAEVDGSADVTLNEQLLGTIYGSQVPAEFEVTKLLRPRNVLSVDITASEPDGGLGGEVAMEVRATAFLRDVRFERRGGKLVAQGVVVGTAPRPLDIYLLADNRCVSQDRIEPAASGRAFTLTAEHQLASAPLPVRVELIDAATVWWVVGTTV